MSAPEFVARRRRLRLSSGALSRAGIVAAAIAASLGITWSSTAAAATAKAARSGGSPTTISVITSASTEDLDFYIALVNGYFAAHNIKIDQITASGGGSSGLPPIVAGTAQAGFLSLSTALEAIEKGQDVREGASTATVATWTPIVSVAFLKKEGLTPAAFEKLSVKQRWQHLKGTVWGVGSAGGVNDRAVAVLAKQYGVGADVTEQAVAEHSTQDALLKAGRLSAILANYPDNVELVNSGEAVYVETLAELLKGSPAVAYTRGSQLIINDGWFKSHKSAAYGFFAAWQEGSNYLFSHTPAQVAADLYKDSAFSALYSLDTLKTQVAYFKSETPRNSEETAASIKETMQFSVESGAISHALPVSKVLDFSYFPKSAS